MVADPFEGGGHRRSPWALFVRGDDLRAIAAADGITDQQRLALLTRLLRQTAAAQGIRFDPEQPVSYGAGAPDGFWFLNSVVGRPLAWPLAGIGGL